MRSWPLHLTALDEHAAVGPNRNYCMLHIGDGCMRLWNRYCYIALVCSQYFCCKMYSGCQSHGVRWMVLCNDGRRACNSLLIWFDKRNVLMTPKLWNWVCPWLQCQLTDCKFQSCTLVDQLNPFYARVPRCTFIPWWNSVSSKWLRALILLNWQIPHAG